MSDLTMSDLVIGMISGFISGIFAAVAFLYGRRKEQSNRTSLPET